MKIIPVIYILLLSVLVCSCRQKKDNEMYWLSPYPIYIQYNQQVEGFDVKAIVFNASTYKDDYGKKLYGNAILKFTDKTGYSFFVYNNCYSDIIEQVPSNLDVFKSNIISLDYPTPLPKRRSIGVINISPFFFKDVDFDGKKELLVNKWVNRFRRFNDYNRHCHYDVYKVFRRETSRMYTPDYVYFVEQITDTPFNPLKGNATFNEQEKTITVRYNPALNAGRVFTYLRPSDYILIYKLYPRKKAFHNPANLMNTIINEGTGANRFKLDTLIIDGVFCKETYIRKGDSLVLESTQHY